MKPPLLIAIGVGSLLIGSSRNYAIEFQATDIRVDKGSGTVASSDVSLATNGSGAIYAGWLDYRNGPNQVFFNYSLDYGQTWSGSDTQFSSVTSQDLMVISGGGNKVYAIWAEDGATNRNIMFRYSANNGSSWSSSTQVNTTTDGQMERPRLAYCDNNVYAIWRRYASGNQGILFRRSTNGGVKWEGLDSEFSWGTVDYPTLVADSSGHVYAAWQKWDDDDVYFSYSADYGGTWSYQTKLNNATGGTQEYISLGYSGGNVYAVWKDGWFPQTVRFDRSTNYGQTWGNPDTFLNQTGGYILRPYLANGSNGEVYGIWTDDRNGNVRNVYFNASADYGESWMSTDVRMTTFSADYGKLISGSSGHVYAVYDDTQTMDTLYCQASSDTGENWDSRVKVSAESPNDGSQRYFGLATDTQNLYIAWRESRTGVYGFFFNYAQIRPTIPPPTPTRMPTRTPTPSPFPTSTPTSTPLTTPTASSTPLYIISGLVETGAGMGIANATMHLSGYITDIAFTNSSGYYQFSNLPSGRNFSVTPEKSGWVFIPESGSVIGINSDLEWNYLGRLITPTPAVTPTPSTGEPLPWIYDYNGDGTSDIAVFRGSTGMWSIRNVTRVYFGSATDDLVPGDYNGDRTTDTAIFRESTGMWSVRDISRFYLGSTYDQPVQGDYNGDGTVEAGIFRETVGLWSIRDVTRVYLGSMYDIVIPGYYDSDGTKDVAIFRGSSGMWSVRNITRFYLGSSTDELVPGDYNGAGKWEGGIFRESSGLWSIRNVTRMYLGSANDWPLPADYNGDTVDEAGIFRDSSGMWSIRNLTRVYFGGTGDIPVTR